MIKILSVLSMIFALLAGFNACGSVKNDEKGHPDIETAEEELSDTEHPDIKTAEEELSDTEHPDDTGGNGDDWGETEGNTTYGVGYTTYISVEISGKVVDNNENGLEKIKIEPESYFGSEIFAYTEKDGKFLLAFDYIWDDGGDFSSWDIDLMISDSENIYKNEVKNVTVRCQEKSSGYDPRYDCKKELVEIVMEKIDGEEPDTENPDIDEIPDTETPDTETNDESTDGEYI